MDDPLRRREELGTMGEILAWGAVIGTWLLVAGPIYQAALELGAERIEVDRLRALNASLPATPAVSNWWWLLPPVRLILSRRRAVRRRNDALGVLSDSDLSAITSYANKAVGWMFVGTGGLLIALRQTYHLTEDHNWPTVTFWLLSAAAAACCLSATRGLQRRKRAARRPAHSAGKAQSQNT